MVPQQVCNNNVSSDLEIKGKRERERERERESIQEERKQNIH